MIIDADLITGFWLGWTAATGFFAMLAIGLLWIGVKKGWW